MKDRGTSSFGWFRPLLGLAALTAIACRDDAKAPAAAAPRPNCERVVDLLTELGEVEVLHGVPYRPERKVWGDRFVNSVETYLHVAVLPNLSLRFPVLEVHPRAVLHYGFGRNKVVLRAAETPVRFTLELVSAEEDGDALAPTVLVDRSVDPRAADGARITGSIDLSAHVGRKVRLVASTRTEAPCEEDWPSWFELRVVSDGRPERAEDRFVRIEEVRAHLLDDFSPECVQERPEKAQVGAGNYLDDGPSGQGAVLFAPPPSRVDLPTNLVPGCVLETAVAIDARAAERTDAAVSFEIWLDDEKIHEEALRPPATRSAVRVALGDRSGDAVVSLRTRPLAEEGSPPLPAQWLLPRVLEEREYPCQDSDPARPSVLWIVVDTLRADRLGCYGCERPTSPNLDAMAGQSDLFEQAIATAPWTLPSTASMLTSRYPLSHGVLNDRSPFLHSSLETLPERLAEEGLRTAAFVSNLLVSHENNFSQGFETYQTLSWGNAGKLERRFLDWLDGSHANDRFFAYLHAVDPHAPYAAPGAAATRFEDPDGPYHGLDDAQTMAKLAEELGPARDPQDPRVLAAARHLLDRYDAEIAYFDSVFGHLRAELESRGRWDSTIVVVTADHGEEFFEHGRPYHTQQLYEESVRVPLLIKVPGRGGRRHAELVETVGLKPTILSLLGLPAGRDDQGLDLFAATSEHAFSSTELGVDDRAEGLVLKNSVRDGRFKLISTPSIGRRELYDLVQDPLEHHDLADREPDRVRSLGESLDVFVRRTAAERPPEVSGLDPDVRRRMEELGYISRSKDDER